jgi:CyaY protein
MSASSKLDDKEYRKKLNEVYARVAKVFDTIDPDLAEVETSLGSCTIITPKGKIILSPQPPVKQLWLAAASQGIAAHFDWDEKREVWAEDKDPERELWPFLREILKKATGLDVAL